MLFITGCGADNDFVKLLSDNGIGFKLASTASALTEASCGDAVAILAGAYPCGNIIPESWRNAAQSGIKLLIEYPDKLSGVDFEEAEPFGFRRTVAMADAIPGLSGDTILVQHTACCRKVKSQVVPLLVAAKVAGYRKAVFGLPDDYTPLLFHHPDYKNVLIINSGFSNFRRGRFTPQPDWLKVLEYITGFLVPEGADRRLAYTMAVHPAFPDGTPVTPALELEAFRKCYNFLTHYMLGSYHNTGLLVAEGYCSEIYPDGSQLRRQLTRTDCTGEVAMVYVLKYLLDGDPLAADRATRLVDNLFMPGNCCMDESSPMYGQFTFFENTPAYYCSGNARSCMGALLTACGIGEHKWDKGILRNLIGGWRLNNRNGFRRPRFDDPESFTGGREINYYRNEDFEHLSPHYQASMLAGLLLGWKLTGWSNFLTPVKRAMTRLMSSYPRLKWTNGQSQEVARLLMTAAWLVRVEDSEEHRLMVDRILSDVLRLMAPCGAIKEEMGDLEMGDFPSPQSNEAYGTTEAALIQSNGDPACDLLYTANFMFISLHEAAAACPDSGAAELEDKLCRFLCRIQAESEDQPYLNGAWLRGFDWELWDYYGSAADSGWGAWSVESGWSCSWISATLALRSLKKSLWDCYPDGWLNPHLEEILRELNINCL